MAALRVRKDQDQNQHGRWAGTQDGGAQKTSLRMDGLDSEPPSRLHFLGAVRTQPSDHGSQRSQEITGGAESRPLEARWNTALRKAPALEDRLRDCDEASNTPAIPDKEILLSLAQDLPAVWNSPGTEAGLKQRIVRILVEEVVADVDEEQQQIVLLIHWAGGRHSALRVSQRGTGQHGHSTGTDAMEAIRRMAGHFADGEIAATLNRLRLRTRAGNSWNAQRVYGLRRQCELPGVGSQAESRTATLQQAVERLGVSELSIRRLIEQKVLPAKQAVPCAPWEIPLEALNLPLVKQAIDNARKRKRPPTTSDERTDPLFSES
jgi:hypothetical protein